LKEEGQVGRQRVEKGQRGGKSIGGLQDPETWKPETGKWDKRRSVRLVGRQVCKRNVTTY